MSEMNNPGLVEYATLRDKIRAEKLMRQCRYVEFAALYKRAHVAGMAAGTAAQPTAMVVTEQRTGEQWHVADGACGFAWVTVHPATCSFARWYAKTHPGSRKAYGGGLTVTWVHDFGQSMERKSAYASAFADVLSAAGIKAYAGSRMD